MISVADRAYLNDLKVVHDAERQGDWNFDDKNYCRDDWKAEVVSGDTQLGYFAWVIHKYDAAYESGLKV